MAIKTATYAKAGVISMIICISLAVILFVVLHFTNKQDDTDESDDTADYSNAVSRLAPICPFFQLQLRQIY